MQKQKYYIGQIGSAGKRCNGCSENIEQLKEGEFTSLKEARRAAAQIATQWANEPFKENKEIQLAIVQIGEKYDDCLHIVTGIPGKQKAKWD